MSKPKEFTTEEMIAWIERATPEHLEKLRMLIREQDSISGLIDNDTVLSKLNEEMGKSATQS